MRTKYRPSVLRADWRKLCEWYLYFPDDEHWNPIESITLQEIGFHGEPIKAESYCEKVWVLSEDDE